jgi:eukaryotic-like serine/threonine-protein kinase
VTRPLSDAFGLVGVTLDGQYRVESVVGEGGFGIVYRGFHVALEQPIAIKALKIGGADDSMVQETLLRKFREEARLLYTLSQSSLHIVRSLDFGAAMTPASIWAPYMVLEWLEGKSLAEDLEERRSRGLRGRSLDEVLGLLQPAAEGLSVAHDRRIAHRDIKPGNIFLLSAGAAVRTKVLDFGIAKILQEDDPASPTRSAFSSFTWAYAAPEQLDPRLGPTSLATDVYSFALVLAEALTDKPATMARDPLTLLKAATDRTVRPTPRGRGANIPDEIEAACRKALAVDPRERFATIPELWSALTTRRSRPVTGPIPAHDRQSHPNVQRPFVPAPPVMPPIMPPVMPPAMPPYAPPISHVMQTGPITNRPAPMPTGSSSATVIVTIVAFVIAVILAGSCALIHAAC